MSTATMDIATKPREVTSRVSTIDWSRVPADLDAQGWAVLPKLLSANECDSVAASYDQDAGFRSHVIMARHGFGRGEYKYFAYPLPSLVEELRTDLPVDRGATEPQRENRRLGLERPMERLQRFRRAQQLCEPDIPAAQACRECAAGP